MTQRVATINSAPPAATAAPAPVVRSLWKRTASWAATSRTSSITDSKKPTSAGVTPA